MRLAALEGAPEVKVLILTVTYDRIWSPDVGCGSGGYVLKTPASASSFMRSNGLPGQHS